MKILMQINYVGGLGADRWIGSGFKDGFEARGHEVFWLTTADDLDARLREVAPDVVMIGQSMLTRMAVPIFAAARGRGTKVVVRVDSFFDQDPEVGEALLHGDPADLYYGEVENPWMDRFTKATGKPYHIIANAAHEKHHFPGKQVKKYAHEIVFLGAWMPNKREAFELLLTPLRKKYDVRVFGPNWTMWDNALRSAAFGLRKVGMMKANELVSNLRLQVPVEEERDLYASAKISINIHERGDHIKNHVILNERTFKIPACGGFEICDLVPPLRRYFTESEMVMADDTKGDWVRDWFEKIDYYIRNDKEREGLQAAGTARALTDHTYVRRVDELLALLGR